MERKNTTRKGEEREGKRGKGKVVQSRVEVEVGDDDDGCGSCRVGGLKGWANDKLPGGGGGVNMQ